MYISLYKIFLFFNRKNKFVFFFILKHLYITNYIGIEQKKRTKIPSDINIHKFNNFYVLEKQKRSPHDLNDLVKKRNKY